VAQAYNPNYSGGRDQEDEDRSLKPQPRQRVHRTLSRKNPQKKAGRIIQGVGPEFRPQYCKKKRKKKFLFSGHF
jgi:hypothetical protein